jgi:arsenite oxidase large subunit
MYAYQYFENTYALTKLAWVSIQTPAVAWHDSPSVADPAPGWTDIGYDTFACAYEDFALADTIFIEGTDPFETKTILWNEWIMKGISERGTKVVFSLPVKTTGVAYAEKMGGVHLWLYPVRVITLIDGVVVTESDGSRNWPGWWPVEGAGPVDGQGRPPGLGHRRAMPTPPTGPAATVMG